MSHAVLTPGSYTQPSVSELQCLICSAHCDALNQSLDGPAGRHLKRDFVDFREGTMWIQSVACDSPPPLPIRAEPHKYWEIYDYVAFVDNAVPQTYSEFCKEVRSLWTSSYHREADSQTNTHTHTHAQAAFSPTLLVGQATTCNAVMACTQAWSPDAKQELFEMLIMGRKGREESRAASPLLRVFTSCFLFVSLNWVLPWRGLLL